MAIKANCGGLILDDITLEDVEQIVTTKGSTPISYFQASCGKFFDSDVFKLVDGVVTDANATEDVVPVEVFCGSLVVDSTYFSVANGALSFEGSEPVEAPTITSFIIDDVEGVIEGKAITVTMPSGTDVTNLVPEIEVSEGATVDPPSEKAQDFTTKVTYRVSNDYDYIDYEVTVVVEA